MKVLLIILGIVVVAALAVVVGCRMLASRSTEATITLTAKVPGKIAVVYYSQSKVGNTATVAKWIARRSWSPGGSTASTCRKSPPRIDNAGHARRLGRRISQRR